MNLTSYNIAFDSDLKTFEFTSEGPNGKIKKVILFSKLSGMDSIYNLAFGDYNEAEKKIDDLIVSDNKDSEKVLATVAKAALLFTKQYPNAQVFVKGSTPSRTRFYCLGISKHLEEINDSFEILGALNDREWELFKRNKTYDALLARRKRN